MAANPEPESFRAAPDHEAATAILVVEDNRDDVMLLKRALCRAGIRIPVLFARDGREAIDYLERRPPFEDCKTCPLPSLMILDLHLPQINGFDVLAWLRQHPRFQNLKVVVFSGVERKSDAERAYALGADLFALKPANWEEFANRVKLLTDQVAL